MNLPNYMKYLYTLLALALGGCAQYSEPPAQAGVSAAKAPQAAIAQILEWWPGDYDNRQQVTDLLAAGEPVWRADDTGKGGHIEVESHYRLINLPAIGKHVLYVEELKHGKPDEIFRQRLYTLSAGSDNQQVRVKLWYFNDKKKYVGAWRDLSRLAEITPDDMYALQDGCDLIVSLQGDGRYHMKMGDRACAFGKNYFNYQVLLGPDSFWFRDKIQLLADDSIISVAGDFTYHELLRMPN